MQPISHKQAFLLLQKLGAEIRLLLAVAPDEPLPAGMGLLLMRLAMVARKGAVGQEARGGLEFSREQSAEGFEPCLDMSSRLGTGSRSRYQTAAG